MVRGSLLFSGPRWLLPSDWSSSSDHGSLAGPYFATLAPSDIVT
jgi:hypothetical protein